MARKRDCWAEWLAQMRAPADPDFEEPWPPARFRDRLLDNAGDLDVTTTLLDVGCGEGLVGFGALQRGVGTVVFSDISRDVLDVCESRAVELGVFERCRFVRAPSEDLTPIDDGSIDVATTRSVLIYVADKEAAFGELARVLRPGGRISLFEPINRFAQTDGDTWAGYDLSALPGIAEKIRAVYDTVQPPATDPMFSFDERDLVRLAEQAGFFPIHLELEIVVCRSDPTPWEDFVSRAGNPRIPTLRDAMEQALAPDERDRLIRHLRPRVEEGAGVARTALAYLHATKAVEPRLH